MYRLYDNLDLDMELLRESEDINEIAAACCERDYDTDGEWYAILTHDDKAIEKWHYEIRGQDGERTRIIFE